MKYSPEVGGQKYKEQGIWILDGNEPTRINIKEGASDDTNVEIISNKVKDGDKVILSSTGGKKSSKNTPTGTRRRGGPPGMF